MKKVCWMLLAVALCCLSSVSWAGNATSDGGGQGTVAYVAANTRTSADKSGAQKAAPQARQSSQNAGQKAGTSPAKLAASPAKKVVPSLHTHLKIGTDGVITVTQRFTHYPQRWRFYFGDVSASCAPFADANTRPEVVVLTVDGKKSDATLDDSTSDIFMPMEASSEGTHTYVLVYKVTKKILFEDDYDRLVWSTVLSLSLKKTFPIQGNRVCGAARGRRFSQLF